MRERLREVAVELRSNGDVPGLSAAVVLSSGEQLLVTDGWADPVAGVPMTGAHRLLSGSVGKTYVTGLAHLLVRDRDLDLDTRAWDLLGGPDWLAQVPNGETVTLHQLLRHESGIPRYVFEQEFWQVVLREPDKVWDPREQLAYVAGMEPLFAPGEGWAYSDTNYLIVGLVLEQVGGAPIDDQIRERLLAPHALRDTLPSDRRELPRLAQGHVVAGRALGVPELTLEEGQFVFNPQFEGCGGGYMNTPADLARWARLLFSGRLLGDEVTSMLHAAVPSSGLGPGREYGSGVMVTPTRLGRLYGHEGFMPGYLTAMGWFPELDLAVALQVNSDDSRALGLSLTEALVRLAEAVDPGAAARLAVPPAGPGPLPEDVELTTLDGLRIAAHWYPAREVGRRPALLLLHGGNRAKEDWRHSGFVRAFAGGPYHVLALDLRGRGQSEAGDAAALKRDPTLAWADIDAALAWLAAREDVDAERVALVGSSYGANLATSGTRTRDWNVRTLVTFSCTDAGYRFLRGRSGLRPLPSGLYIASEDEPERYAAGATAVRLEADTRGRGQVVVFPGPVHAQGLMQTEPEVEELVREWLAQELGRREH